MHQLEVFLMSEVHQEALISREGQLSSANSTVAKRSGRVATKLDSLLVLAAVLAYIFGWGPVGVYTGAVIIVAVSLLWLLCERVVPLKGRWVASDGWLGALTQLDVLILLGALFLSTLHEILLLLAVVVWASVSGLAWLRGQRASADDWFHRAAIFASFVAIMISEEASKIWLYSGATGAPSPLTHAGFHQFLDGSIEVSCVLLFLLLAWTDLRQGQGRAIAVLYVGGLPVAALAAWAAAVAIINQRDYGVPARLRLAPHGTLGAQRAQCRSRSCPSATSSFHGGCLRKDSLPSEWSSPPLGACAQVGEAFSGPGGQVMALPCCW